MQTDDPMDYRIADLRIRIPGECLPGPLHPAFSPFAEPENGTPALLLHTARQIADVPEGCCLDRFPCIDTTTECRFIRWSGGIQLELYGPQGDSVRFRLPDGGREACTDGRPDRQPSQLRFGLWLLCNAAGLGHGVVSLHAAAISHRGQGVLFLGESGTGKSTHARLWCRHMAATELLNDDSPFIRLQPAGAPLVYGSPWSGKSPCYRSPRSSGLSRDPGISSARSARSKPPEPCSPRRRPPSPAMRGCWQRSAGYSRNSSRRCLSTISPADPTRRQRVLPAGRSSAASPTNDPKLRAFCAASPPPGPAP